LSALALKLVSSGPDKIELTPRRVRLLYNGVYIADTIAAKHVWEHKYYPQLYIPAKSFKSDILVKGEPIDSNASAFYGIIKVKDKQTDKVILFEKGSLNGLVKVDFNVIDAWFEEDEQIFVHPKDPYKRVDIRSSSRHVKVVIDGHTIAETNNPTLLFETLLPPRYYLPKTSVVDWSMLADSPTISQCPYKGEANYYDVTVNGQVYKDIIWWYRTPTVESSAVAGRLCFYNEKVDIWIDGQKQERPITKFS
ncbi:DUF427-domain-containing protein, partial [Ramaria rubella]